VGRGTKGSRSIRLNGEAREVAAATLTELLDELGIEVERRGIALALNGEVVPRGKWNETQLTVSDEVEIVGAVQGG
jgi:sulfur carrier protein